MDDFLFFWIGVELLLTFLEIGSGTGIGSKSNSNGSTACVSCCSFISCSFRLNSSSFLFFSASKTFCFASLRLWFFLIALLRSSSLKYSCSTSDKNSSSATHFNVLISDKILSLFSIIWSLIFFLDVLFSIHLESIFRFLMIGHTRYFSGISWRKTSLYVSLI